MLSSTQGVCYPNKKKGGLQLSANARWLFRNPVSGGHCCSLAGTTQRARASRERGFSSLIKKLFLTQSVYNYQSITLQAARDWPQNPQKEFYLIEQWIWIFFSRSLFLSIFSPSELNLITCQHRPSESYCYRGKQKFSPFRPGSSAKFRWQAPRWAPW